MTNFESLVCMQTEIEVITVCHFHSKLFLNFNSVKCFMYRYINLPGQGSLHFWLIQAWVDGQLVFRTHSGLQPTKGFPMYPSFIQSQTAPPSKTVQIVFDPQGLGLQGSAGGGGPLSRTHL